MENRNETIEELNDILEKCIDSVKGFRKAAEDATDGRLKSYFNQQVTKRQGFIDELTAEVRSLGGEPTQSGSTGGAFHRAWIDFKTALSFDKDESVLEACITGEKACINEYDDLLEESHLPSSTRNLLIIQRSQVQATLTELEAKEEMYD